MLSRAHDKLIKHVTCQLKNFNYIRGVLEAPNNSTVKFAANENMKFRQEFSAKVFQSMSFVAATRR